MKILQNKILIAIGLFLLFVFIISIIYIIINQPDTNTSKDSSETITYVDPGSGETVITTPNKVPEVATGEDIVTLGFTALIDRGASKEQVDRLKSYFVDYSKNLETPIQEVSITKASIGKVVNDGIVYMDFDVTINRSQTLKAHFQYAGLSDPSLSLYSDNKLIFKSK